MKRLLMLAAVVGGLTFAGTTNTAEAHPRGGFRGGHHHHHHHGGRGFYGYNNFGRFGGYGYRPGVFIGTPNFQFGYGTTIVRPYSGWGGGYGYGGGCGW
jgi:hypothetical protein